MQVDLLDPIDQTSKTTISERIIRCTELNIKQFFGMDDLGGFKIELISNSQVEISRKMICCPFIVAYHHPNPYFNGSSFQLIESLSDFKDRIEDRKTTKPINFKCFKLNYYKQNLYENANILNNIVFIYLKSHSINDYVKASINYIIGFINNRGGKIVLGVKFDGTVKGILSSSSNCKRFICDFQIAFKKLFDTFSQKVENIKFGDHIFSREKRIIFEIYVYPQKNFICLSTKKQIFSKS